MSFNQYRTNPGQAVSNFKGRTDTPKAWPSTLVSAWTNGGLFGGGSLSETWILITSSDPGQWNATGQTRDGLFNNYDGGTQSDGSMMVSAIGGSNNRVISVTDKGIIRDNAFVGPEGASYYFGATYMNGFAYDETSDVVYSPMQAVINSYNQYVKCAGVQVMPGTNVDTTSTTITDLKLTDPGNSTGDNTNVCYITDAANGKFMLVGANRGSYPGVIFGQVVSGSIVWGDFNKASNYPTFYGKEFQCASIGDSGRFYYYGTYRDENYNQKLAVVCSNDTTGGASFGNSFNRGFAYTTNLAFNAINTGTYSGEDQVALGHLAQQTGNYDFGITIFTPNNGNVQSAIYIYNSTVEAYTQPGAQILAKDSAGNFYALMRRKSASSSGYYEMALVKLDSSLTVQWIRIISASLSSTFSGTSGYDFGRACGVTVSNDDNYVTVMGELNFQDSSNAKLFMSRFAADGSGYGALSDSGAAINIGNSPDVGSGGRSDWAATACYIRYYDNGDASNWATVNVATLTGTWSSMSTSQSVASGHTAVTPPAYNHTNQANWYGSYPVESWA